MNGTTELGNYKSERFFTLVGDLQDDVKHLIKKEIDLAKTEMSEKFGAFGKHAGFAAAGGVLALIAVFMLLLGFGAVVSQLLQKAGLSAGTAYFVSYMGLSLILGGAGYFLIHKAMSEFAQLSLSPEKALAGAKGAEPVPLEIRKGIENNAKHSKPPKPSSDDLQSEVIAARTRMDSEMSELKSRLTPGYLARSFFAGIKHHPTRAILIGASTGLGGYLCWRNLHMAEIKRIAANRKWWQFKVRSA